MTDEQDLRAKCLALAVDSGIPYESSEQVVALAETYYQFITNDEPPYQCCADTVLEPVELTVDPHELRIDGGRPYCPCGWVHHQSDQGSIVINNVYRTHLRDTTSGVVNG